MRKGGLLNKILVIMMFSMTMIFLNFITSEASENRNIISLSERLALGGYHTGVITEDGSLYMWGDNRYGQVGNGSTKEQLIPSKVLSDVIALSAKGNLSAAITSDGSLYMWGENGCGQVGNGSQDNQLTPVKILSDVVSVSLGGYHCGAITKDGSLYMWGYNRYGQVGNGSTVNKQLIPVKILSDVVSVSLGGEHSGAITKDGSLYMWGYNSDGQLGINWKSYEKSVSKPRKLNFSSNLYDLCDIRDLYLKAVKSGAITLDGNLYMWGCNRYGNIGNGNTEDQLIPRKVMSDVEKVVLGEVHSAAITLDGSLYMWGSNNCGQIGNGSTKDQLTPKKILSNVVAVSVKSNSSGAITSDGSLYMWGSNDYGQIGNGSVNNQLTPTKILSNVETVNLSGYHSGAITSDGSLYMWGNNRDGQIGNNSTKDQLTPLKIMTIGKNTVDVHVTAIDKSINQSVPVPYAEVYLYVGEEERGCYTTDSEGYKEIPLDHLTEKELQKATISAKKIVSQGKAINGTARDDLFEHFSKDEKGNYYRYTMELHSETIYDVGNWVGAAIPGIDKFSLARELELKLREPRMLVNLSVCYFADDETSQSDTYRESVMKMLNEYSNRMAEATDAHIMIDKILLFSTDNRLDFYDTENIASMADIRIETEESDSGIGGMNVQIHSNASIVGFFLDTTYTAAYDENTIGDNNSDNDVTEHFTNLQNGNELNGRESFRRIQMSGLEGAGWNNSIIDQASAYSTTVMHETGHYLIGLFDEYLNYDGEEWGIIRNRKPYASYGLMDDQHEDIEISRAIKDYQYLKNGFENLEAEKEKHTFQSWVNKGACEDTLSSLLSDQELQCYHESIRRGIIDSDFSLGKYKSNYSKVKGADDHTATYWYAELDDSDFLSVPLHDTRAVSLESNENFETTELEEVNEFLASSSAVLTKEPVADVSFAGTSSAMKVTVKGNNGTAYTVSYRKAGEDSYRTAKLTNGTASLIIAKGELAEVRISDGKNYNCYYIDRTPDTDAGYIYTSADNAVMAYVANDTDDSYTFIADNTDYTNGSYSAVNQATWISSGSGKAFDSGEIYSVASYMAEIDYTTLTWFKYADGKWTALETDYSTEENRNIGARADLDGAGLYVLMAEPAVGTKVVAAKYLKYQQSKDRDAVVTLTFNDPNTTSKYYNVYYSDEPLTDKDADNVVVRSFDAVSQKLTLNLLERGRTVYAAVEIVLEDGSRSELSRITVTGGEADSDGDGIPDWYCNLHQLWGENGENKDIVGSDDDGDGLTNLEEYQKGTDPKCKDEIVAGTDIIRIYGENRYETSYAVADALKLQMGVDKFHTVIIANGKNFPDALAGSYLAGVKNAPILMANEKYKDSLQSYVKANLKAGGTIYVLGGTAAVPQSVLNGLTGYHIERLAGTNRYETNLLILEAAGVGDEEILVCTGKTFADSLSASATGKPILLVNNKALTEGQKAFLKKHTSNKFYIIGGTSAVSKTMENAIHKYVSTKRIYGEDRYETSVEVAKAFFKTPDSAVLAYAKNFPDGLSGGPLAMEMNVPLILTSTGKTDAVAGYVSRYSIEEGFVLGGSSLISDAAVQKIF